jgi:hypothetical protein
MNVRDTHTNWHSARNHDVPISRVTTRGTSWELKCDAVVESQSFAHNFAYAWELLKLCPCYWILNVGGGRATSARNQTSLVRLEMRW